MPSKGRALVNVRLSDAGIAFLAKDAERLGVSRSDVIRAALARWAALPEKERKVPRS